MAVFVDFSDNEDEQSHDSGPGTSPWSHYDPTKAMKAASASTSARRRHSPDMETTSQPELNFNEDNPAVCALVCYPCFKQRLDDEPIPCSCHERKPCVFHSKRASCARDMVSSCRRCGMVVCRNCAIKPPAPILLNRRLRQICQACQDIPIASATRPPLPPDTPIDSPMMQHALCSCMDSVWLCQPCGFDIHRDDPRYCRDSGNRNQELLLCPRGSECEGFQTTGKVLTCTPITDHPDQRNRLCLSRSWCGWCWRIVPSLEDLTQRNGSMRELPTLSQHC